MSALTAPSQVTLAAVGSRSRAPRNAGSARRGLRDPCDELGKRSRPGPSNAAQRVKVATSFLSPKEMRP
jgi:hypothetical protein